MLEAVQKKLRNPQSAFRECMDTWEIMHDVPVDFEWQCEQTEWIGRLDIKIGIELYRDNFVFLLSGP